MMICIHAKMSNFKQLHFVSPDSLLAYRFRYFSADKLPMEEGRDPKIMMMRCNKLCTMKNVNMHTGTYGYYQEPHGKRGKNTTNLCIRMVIKNIQNIEHGDEYDDEHMEMSL